MAAVVNCPTCGAKVEWIEANKFRPFCSDRCKQIDLGAWAEEKYVIPVANPLEDFEDDAPAQPSPRDH
ncbi:DNA gyrase inhibitor YacG [uncultured Oxalicibacterium sp.]|uniref:DNA gyrase inhibitor YacG n=1 Tax=uncultured Oxalicibacterium sp. TaxID=1168540 RepID=UPI0025D9AA8B|nr:DNA gyrase inhibitor YacG [uncultured Oxalicibacterium sp.]